MATKGKSPAKEKKKNKEEENANELAYTKLSTKEKNFYITYLELNNATKAYQSLHPKVTYNTAGVEGHKYLKRPKIQAALQEYYNKIWDSKNDMIGDILKDLYRASKADIYDVMELTEDGGLKFRDFKEVDTSIVQEVGQTVSDTQLGRNTKNSIKIVDKQKARSDLLRVLGMIQDKVKVEINYDKESAEAIKEIFNESLTGEKTDE